MTDTKVRYSNDVTVIGTTVGDVSLGTGLVVTRRFVRIGLGKLCKPVDPLS